MRDSQKGHDFTRIPGWFRLVLFLILIVEAVFFWKILKRKTLYYNTNGWFGGTRIFGNLHMCKTLICVGNLTWQLIDHGLAFPQWADWKVVLFHVQIRFLEVPLQDPQSSAIARAVSKKGRGLLPSSYGVFQSWDAIPGMPGEPSLVADLQFGWRNGTSTLVLNHRSLGGTTGVP